MKSNLFVLSLLGILLVVGCQPPDPNVDLSGENEFESHEIVGEISEENMSYGEMFYVPIYSDIYIDPQNQNSLLAATLSIRNTSFVDSLFISRIDYYNTEGSKVKSFIDNAISIPPMATINYVIEKDDTSGGPGANFIVDVNAKKSNAKPIIQAIMIGQHLNRGFSFTTEGYSIK